MHSLAFWVVFDMILDVIPEKIRKIVGSVLLIFGSLAILWAIFTDFGTHTGILAIIAFSIGVLSIFFGLYVLTYGWDIFSYLFDYEEYETNEEKKNNPKQQIDCSSCNQKLNIPFSYSGKISCPACGIYIELEEGIIQAEENLSDLVFSEG